ncbi:hypothetical protein NDU88_002928 [Pleurodeles waltl]|uniref:Uncharacterized protein n=1 Tax=Pleurodeles waltl TaxID=8319 RepID=A0AAV7RF76_PLEWA|nr:hypothetical protein NDU88_002928 [Pleurodeles waltl]
MPSVDPGCLIVHPSSGDVLCGTKRRVETACEGQQALATLTAEEYNKRRKAVEYLKFCEWQMFCITRRSTAYRTATNMRGL